MITIDGDKLKPEFWIEYTPGYFAIVYTTHSHVPEAPRARILIPLTRDVSPDEYNAIARYIAEEIGMEQIDPCSFEINQLMYWPTCPSDGEYICQKYEGDWLDPDVFLSAHPDWKDCTKLPTASAEKSAVEKARQKQQDPLTKDGIIGAFCRARTMQEMIREFLPPCV